MADIIPPSEIRPTAEAAFNLGTGAPEVAISPQPKDLLIVFGQGPVKPLFRREDFNPSIEADKARLEEWDKFKKDPLHSTEPDFRILDTESHLSLEGEELNPFLKNTKDKTPEELDAQMIEWQNQGRFGLNRWGRENAIASGFALLSGQALKVDLSGGKTIPEWAKSKLSQARLDSWPSEAALMRDIIVRRFGKLYQEKFGKPIEDAIILEDASLNTLENFANTVNLNPQVLEPGVAGGLATDFHAPRTERIGFLFTGEDGFDSLSAQSVLNQRLGERNAKREGLNSVNAKTGELKPVGNKMIYQEIVDWMLNPKNADLGARSANEKAFDGALQDPELLTYWLGYVGIVEDPRVLTKTVQRLSSDPRFSAAAQEAFNLAGLDFTIISKTDLINMDKFEFDSIREKLRVLMTKEYRKMPVMPK